MGANYHGIIPYHIRLQAGIWFAENSRREFLDLAELDELIQGLQNTRDVLAKGKSQVELEKMSCNTRLKLLIQNARWVFNENARRYSTLYEPRLYSGECVYFLHGSKRPNLIKIGSTNNVYNRSREHRYEAGDCNLIAVAHTNDCRTYERLLHRHFKDQKPANSGKEWFDFKTVHQWLCKVFTELEGAGDGS